MEQQEAATTTTTTTPVPQNRKRKRDDKDEDEEEAGETRLRLVLSTIQDILGKPASERSGWEWELWCRFRGYHLALLLPYELVDQAHAEIVARQQQQQ